MVNLQRLAALVGFLLLAVASAIAGVAVAGSQAGVLLAATGLFVGGLGAAMVLAVELIGAPLPGSRDGD